METKKIDNKTEVMKDHSVRFPEETWKEIGRMLSVVDLKNNNEFIREAVKFYIEWLKKPKDVKFISDELESVMRASVRDSENRLARIIFKLAVQVCFLSSLIGYQYNYSESGLREAMNDAEDVVRETNGNVDIINVIMNPELYGDH